MSAAAANTPVMQKNNRHKQPMTSNKPFKILRNAEQLKRNRKYKLPKYHAVNQSHLAARRAIIIVGGAVAFTASAFVIHYLIIQYSEALVKLLK